jgi:RNA polymerase sigma-70 factor (ECF subfamily)
VYSKQKAEDLVVEVFALFWKNGLYGKVKGTYRSYLYAAVRNKCFTYLKWELKKEASEELTDVQLQSFYPTPEQILQASDLHLKIERLIKAMPPRQQQIFVMSRFEGKKNNQIAAAMQLSVKTVEMHISRSLAKFRKMFNE